MKTEGELRHEALRIQQLLIDEFDIDSKLTRDKPIGETMKVPKLSFGIMTLHVHSLNYFKDYKPAVAFEYVFYHPSRQIRTSADVAMLRVWLHEAISDNMLMVSARDEIDRPIF